MPARTSIWATDAYKTPSTRLKLSTRSKSIHLIRKGGWQFGVAAAKGTKCGVLCARGGFYQICDTFDFQPSVSEPTVRYDLNFCGGRRRPLTLRACVARRSATTQQNIIQRRRPACCAA